MQTYRNEIVRYKGQWRAFIFDPRAAALVNRRLKQYTLGDTEWGDWEGVFDFGDSDLAYVRSVLLKFGGLE